MKILMITPYLPYPLLSGGQIRTYNLLKNLKDKHEIHLYALIKDDAEKKSVSELEKFCRTVNLFKRSKRPFTLRNVLLAAVTPYPFLVTRNLPIKAKSVITNALNKGNFDLIHAETFYVMPNIPQTPVPILLVEQTIEYLVYQDFVKQFRVAPLKPFLMFDVYKIKRWEKYYWRRAKRLATMSEEDRQFIREVVPEAKIDVVSNGVDAEFFQEVKRKRLSSPVVLFVGQFKWMPNRDAAHFIHREIWPHIKRAAPDCKLWIVGRHPTADIQALNNEPDVVVDDGIEDIRQAYAAASVLLAPIRSGRGTKYKILEAMASGTPVVATSLGIEGIKAVNGTHVLIADDAEGLAEKTIEILSNQEKAKGIAEAAKKLILKHYNWKKISRELDRIYRQLGKA
ncbi:glycosyltransferase [Patescibacteria group bacterium]|nr:glycosyltransferase [Patescibacteria group bacterium]